MIITLEGANGSGKETQTDILVHRLELEGYTVARYDYPEYDSLTGELISKYLAGEFGPKEELFEFASLLYSADRMKNRLMYRKHLKNKEIIVNNRYMESNWAIQGALIAEADIREERIAWLMELEKNMPPSDLVLYLDVPPLISYELVARRAQLRGVEMDAHENDMGFVEACHDVYLELAQKFAHWNVIACVTAGELQSPEQISESIWQVVSLKLATIDEN